MAFEDSLWSYLTGYAGLSALISTRLYPNVIPETAPAPAVAYQRISRQRWRSRDGYSGKSVSRYQFTAVGDTPSDARDVALQIVAALESFAGTMDGLTVDVAMVDDERDDYLPRSQEYTEQVDVDVIHET